MLIPKTDEEKFKADPLAYIQAQIREKKEKLAELNKAADDAYDGREQAEILRQAYVVAQDIEFMEYWEQSYTKQLKLEL